MESSAHLTGEPFLARVVRDLGMALEIDHLVVAEILPGRGRARSLAIHSVGGEPEPFEYELDCVPCAEVAEGRELILPTGAARRIPVSDLPFRGEVESYLGLPLGLPGEPPRGILAAIHSRPLTVDRRVRTLLHLFSARMGAELARIQSDRKRRDEFEHGRRLVNALNRLALSPELHHGDVPAFARDAAETVARTLDVRTVSIWLRSDEPGHMESVASAGTGGVPVAVGSRLQVGEAYFTQRQRIREVDESTWGSLTPGVQAFLRHRSVRYHVEAAIRVRGQVEGILAVVPGGEGPVAPLDMNFIADVGDLLARAETEARRVAEEERRQALEIELERARKVEALGSLAGGIAHDFNNILTAMLGNAELARMDAPTGLLPLLDDVIQSGEHGKELIAQIFQFVNSQPSDPAPVHLRQVVDDIVRSVRLIAGETRVKVHSTEQDPVVSGDEAQLRQALMNLCANAVSILEGQGTVEVEVLRARRSDVSAHPWLRSRPCYILRVRDDGPGIPPDIRERIFEPFFSTRKNRGGTGLGLAIVDRVVRSHGGVVEVESVEGRGTTFNVYLPLAS